MLSSTRRWFRRYRTPIAIGLGVVGAGYVVSQYVLGKISEARERMSSDRIARENLRRRFEQNQEDCTFTVLALLPTATDNVLGELQTEHISVKLQQYKATKIAKNGDPHSDLGSGPPSVADDDGRSMASQSESGIHTSQMDISSSMSSDGPQDGAQQSQPARKIKLQLWSDLKISAITRSFTLIYTLALLTLLTRIQLNLLGRRSYLSSVISLAAGGPEQSTLNLENNDDDNVDQSYGNDFETNRRYLTFSWWLLHRGWSSLMLKVQSAVKDVFDSINPTDSVDLQKFSELTLEARKRIEGATESERQTSKWLEYLLPPREEEDFVLKESGMATEPTSKRLSGVTPLRRLLDETSDIVDSPPFSHVLTILLDAGFSTLVDQKLAEIAFAMPPVIPKSELKGDRITDISDAKPVKLPKVLAVLTRQAHSIGNGVPNEYLQAMEQVGDLEAFAAVVYSSNWENEISPVGEGSDRPASGERFSKRAEGESLSGQESFLDVGTASTFESAWGKAGGKSS